MQITKETLDQLLDPHARHHAGLHDIAKIRGHVAKQFCDKLTVQSLCPLECAKCKQSLNSIVSSIDPLTVRTPYALLVWLLKREAARAAEKQGQHEMKPKLNMLKEKVDVDPLELLLKELG